MLALTETKLKGNVEVSGRWENSIIADIQEKEKEREGVAILLNDVLYSAVINFESVSYRILRVKFRFSSVKVCVVMGYGPTEGMRKRVEVLE